ncbi:Aste57867_21027 [Aphanomyces stellatus]|uniref:Aste57867_21027 protein n=1 Tax=Aphanomyces stellatus TaxID=120398 RepID=A0A485LGK0_9STRA|nr:hypothetical protein As57867_020959 [Aphanomyces stellatus]VFT97702.1 Aste57867_21027 [Aphanomyces stellatus]
MRAQVDRGVKAPPTSKKAAKQAAKEADDIVPTLVKKKKKKKVSKLTAARLPSERVQAQHSRVNSVAGPVVVASTTPTKASTPPVITKTKEAASAPKVHNKAMKRVQPATAKSPSKRQKATTPPNDSTIEKTKAPSLQDALNFMQKQMKSSSDTESSDDDDETRRKPAPRGGKGVHVAKAQAESDSSDDEQVSKPSVSASKKPISKAAPQSDSDDDEESHAHVLAAPMPATRKTRVPPPQAVVQDAESDDSNSPEVPRHIIQERAQRKKAPIRAAAKEQISSESSEEEEDTRSTIIPSRKPASSDDGSDDDDEEEDKSTVVPAAIPHQTTLASHVEESSDKSDDDDEVPPTSKLMQKNITDQSNRTKVRNPSPPSNRRKAESDDEETPALQSRNDASENDSSRDKSFEQHKVAVTSTKAAKQARKTHVPPAATPNTRRRNGLDDAVRVLQNTQVDESDSDDDQVPPTSAVAVTPSLSSSESEAEAPKRTRIKAKVPPKSTPKVAKVVATKNPTPASPLPPTTKKRKLASTPATAPIVGISKLEEAARVMKAKMDSPPEPSATNMDTLHSLPPLPKAGKNVFMNLLIDLAAGDGWNLVEMGRLVRLFCLQWHGKRKKTTRFLGRFCAEFVCADFLEGLGIQLKVSQLIELMRRGSNSLPVLSNKLSACLDADMMRIADEEFLASMAGLVDIVTMTQDEIAAFVTPLIEAANKMDDACKLLHSICEPWPVELMQPFVQRVLLLNAVFDDLEGDPADISKYFPNCAFDLPNRMLRDLEDMDENGNLKDFCAGERDEDIEYEERSSADELEALDDRIEKKSKVAASTQPRRTTKRLISPSKMPSRSLATLTNDKNESDDEQNESDDEQNDSDDDSDDDADAPVVESDEDDDRQWQQGPLKGAAVRRRSKFILDEASEEEDYESSDVADDEDDDDDE